jgi:hypothetical protein
VASLPSAYSPLTVDGRAAALTTGGKAAMLTALMHPQWIERLVVADIAPVQYNAHTGWKGVTSVVCFLATKPVVRAPHTSAAVRLALGFGVECCGYEHHSLAQCGRSGSAALNTGQNHAPVRARQSHAGRRTARPRPATHMAVAMQSARFAALTRRILYFPL